jgi:hypothetical protein
MKRERTQQVYTPEGYGDGSPPKLPTVIVSSSSGPGIIAGKEYPVISHRAYVYVVLNDLGHEKVFSMYSSTHAHSFFYDDSRPPMARVWEEMPA